MGPCRHRADLYPSGLGSFFLRPYPAWATRPLPSSLAPYASECRPSLEGLETGVPDVQLKRLLAVVALGRCSKVSQ